MNNINKSITCVACGNQKNNIVFKANEKMFGLGNEFDYLECGQCGSLQLIALPADLSRYYPKGYYAFQGLNRSGVIKTWLKRCRWFLYKTNLFRPKYPEYQPWLYHLKAEEEDTIADIGCGNGQLLYEMKCSGFKKTYGFDPFLPEEIEEPGFILSRKGIDEINGVFDIVMLHHAFEHMEFPTMVFEKLSSLVKKGGQLLIRLPVTDGEIWKQERINWVQLDAPRHFFIPSVKVMKQLAIKNGFKPKNFIFDSNEFQFTGTNIYKRGKNLIGTSVQEMFTKQEIDWFREEAKRLNKAQKGDQVCLYFERI